MTDHAREAANNIASHGPGVILIDHRDNLAAIIQQAIDAACDEWKPEVEKLKMALRRASSPETCRHCGAMMDNHSPDEEDDQWFCPLCRANAEIERLKAALRRSHELRTH